MTDYLADLLFRPRKLNRYQYTRLWNAFFVIVILGMIAMLPSFIDMARFQGFRQTDRVLVEQVLSTDFADMASRLPNCVLSDNRLTCEGVDGPVTIGSFSTIVGKYTIVVDPTGTYRAHTTDVYLIFGEEGLYYSTSYLHFLFDYQSLPKEWQSIDFSSIREADQPGEALFEFFIAGLNPFLLRLKPFMLVFIAGFHIFAILLRTLFYSFLFFLFFRQFRYGSIFRICAFAQLFPTLLLLILDLLNIRFLSIIPTILIFFYMHRALFPTERKILE